MKVNKSKIFAQFVANLFAGSIPVLTGILLFLEFGHSNPSKHLLSAGLVVISIIGILTFKIITRKHNYKFHFINIGIFLILVAILASIMGFNDWQFTSGISMISILIALLPAIIITTVINWQKF